MKLSKVVLVGAIFMGLIVNGESLIGFLVYPSEETVIGSCDGLQCCVLEDAVPGVEEYGYTVVPGYQPLEIHRSDDPLFEYMARSPYYTVFFKGTTVRLTVQDAWITFELAAEGFGKIGNAESAVEQNLLCVSDVSESVDVSYEVDTSLLREIITLKEQNQFERIIQNISWEGIAPEFQEDGSILFVNEDEKKILRILPPFMRDAEGAVCTGLHYELMETETGYELHKVIDEEGLSWLEHAVYPVVLDPSLETLEDAWESSGLTPYGQYFKNVKEYVNPATGYLTVTQTDLVIPGRGIDFVLSRVYGTPAVFYGSNPYDYEAPPVDVGKGWQLNLPWIGDKYLHLWGGTVYKIEWTDNTFENHRGKHFILVKNGDSTYTLTTVDGMVYEFSTLGKLTEIKDLDENTIGFTYTGEELTSVTDTIGRTITLSYSNDRLWKIVYNNAEIEFSYNGNGCLQWMEDFLNRRTSYSYNTGYNNWLLSKIEYATTGYTTYAYSRFQDGNYYRYYVTHQRVYETNQVRHVVFSYTGSFSAITACTAAVKNEADVTQGSYEFIINDGLITERTAKNASGAALRKFAYTYNSRHEITEEQVYNDGSNLSYTTSYTYDDWGNTIYHKNAEGHERFFSYANTDTSGFFVDNTGSIIQKFTNAFSNCSVPLSVHTVLLGMAEKQDNTYVREMYLTYDVEAHPTHTANAFGGYTTWLTFSGTFNEKTGSTSFPIDLTGYTVAGNGVLQITGLPSDDTYQESHSTNCPSPGCRVCNWLSSGSGWSGKYYRVRWNCMPYPGEYEEGYKSIGPFTHYPGSLGYQSYSTTPALGQSSPFFTVTTNWKAYPVQVKYNLDQSPWKVITSNLRNTTASVAVPITNGLHTLYFSESSSKKTKFSWYLYVPVDNSPDTYTTTITYDTYGNVTSITDAESNTVTFTYSSSYSYAYVTEISTTVGTDTLTVKATYDYDRGWITSLQEPKGVASSGYDYVYTYDLLGRITKAEFPLLSGQPQRVYVEAVYDDAHRTVTLIDQLRRYVVRQYDRLGRLTDIRLYTGTYGSGTLYATMSSTYRYDSKVSAVTDFGNDTYTYTYDFLGRSTQVVYPDSSSLAFSYDDTANKVTLTDGRGYDTVHWVDWLFQLIKVEEEYTTDLFAVTTYQYDEVGHLTSITDAESCTTTYTYASLFGLTQVIYPDSEYEEYEYDNIGNVTSVTDANGNETVLTYDDVYRLTQIQYHDQSTITFFYDVNSNRIKMEDNIPSTGDYVEYTYDCWNRLTTETRHISQDTYTVSYQYDVASRLINLTYPDTMQILYSYDDLDRVTEIKRYVDGITDEILMDNIQYNTEGLLTEFDYGNDLQAIFTYDSRDRPVTIDVKNGETSCLDLDYTYDSNSNVTQLVNGWRDTSSTWHSDTESYNYDGLDRLTSASCTSWSHTYSYDRVGNRTAKDGVTYTINTVNEVTALSDGTSFTYDSNGNRTGKTKGTDTWVYTYDYANRLTEVEKNSETLGEYVYDGDGKRIQTTEDSITTTCIYSGLNVLYEENSTGSATYIYGPTGRLAKRTTIDQEINTFYYHIDHLGSTRLVTDSDKNIVAAITYHPFGKTCTEEGSEDYLFNGKEKDATDLYYYGARYYDPELGRFMTKDPFQGSRFSPQSLNPYAYCLNNPLRYSDLWGLFEDKFARDGGDGDDQGEDDYWDVDSLTGAMIEYVTATGKTIWDFVNRLIDEGRYLMAVVCVLIVQGYADEITSIVCDAESAVGWIYLVIADMQVIIYIGDKHNVDWGKTVFPRKEGDPILIYIYNLAFFHNENSSARKLWHVVGHEMQHVFHVISGAFWNWEEKYGWNAAVIYSEYCAWLWSYQNLILVRWGDSEIEDLFESHYVYYWHSFYGILPWTGSLKQ